MLKFLYGSFTGIRFLAGRGPGIHIQIFSTGSIKTELKSEFIAQGINQTLHRVYLQVECEISILTPFETITQMVTNQVVLMENVIIGNVPETYYNLEGMEGSSDTLNVIQ